MNNELDEALCRDFPEIFVDRSGDMTKTAMCWGFSCGDGWEPLIRMACNRIMGPVWNRRSIIEHMKETLNVEDKSSWTDWMRETFTKENLAKTKLELVELEEQIPVATQVKEKFGGLRFYTTGTNDRDTNIIDSAEAMSYYVCEQCGTMASARLYTYGWHATLCSQHADERYTAEIASLFREQKKNGEY